MKSEWENKKYFELNELPLAMREFKRIFNKLHKNLPIDNVLSFFIFKRVMVDLPKLEEMLVAQDPEANLDISIKEMCIKYGGKEGDEFIQKLIGDNPDEKTNGDESISI